MCGRRDPSSIHLSFRGEHKDPGKENRRNRKHLTSYNDFYLKVQDSPEFYV